VYILITLLLFQYPLYSASLAEYNMEQVGYYLVEERGWALDLAELERSYQAAKVG